MGGGAYLTNRNINNNLALKNQQEQEVDPVAAAIRNVSTPVSTVTPMAVTPKVDSLDQAITPIASNRTTTQLFPDYAPATPEVAIAAPVTGPTPAPTERVPTTASTSGLSVQDFGAQPTFGSPDEALANYGNVFNTLKGQEEQVNKVYNYNNFDPGDFGRTSVSLREGNRAAGTGLAEYVQQNEIPLSKVIDGERKYLTTGNAQANQELWPNAFQGGDLVATGPVGTYSTTFQKDKNLLVQVASDPILQVVGAFFPPLALATTAVKAVAGETLHAGDWLTLANAGLEQAGAIKPPSAGAGGMGPIDNGVGLFGTSYDQTQNIMEAAAAAGSDGNPAEILIKGFGVTDDVLDSIGLDEAAFDDSIVDYTGFVEGVEQAASQVAGGDSIEDAIKGGVLDYIVESEGDIDLGVVTDAVEAVGSFLDDNIFQPIIDTVGDIDLGEFEDTVRDLGREFDDEVLQEIKGGIEEFAPQVEDFVKTVGGATVAAVETAGGITRDVIETVGGEVLDALKPIGTQLEDIAKATGSTVEDVLKGVAGVGEDVLSGVGAVGQDVIDALGPLGTQLEDIARTTGSTVEDVIKGVAKIVETSGGEVIDALEPIGTAITDIAKTTGKTVEDVLEGVGDIAGELSDEIGDAIKAGGNALEDFIEPIGKTIEDIAKTTGSTVEDVLKGVASVGEDIIGEVGDVGQNIIDALKPLGSTLEDIAKATGSTVEDVIKGVVDVVSPLGAGIEDAIKATGSQLEDFIRPIGSAVEDIAKTTGKTVGDVLEGVADLTGDLGSSLEDAIKEGGSALEDFIRPIGSTIEDIARVTGSTTEDVLKGVAASGKEVIGEIGEVGQDVIDALGPLGSTLEDFAKATGSTLEDVLKDIGGLGEDILGGVADVGSDVIDAVKASGLSTEGMLQSGFEGLAAQQAAQAADARRLAVATRTTDSLFSDFKGFETEIGGTPIELVELIQRNRR